MGNMIGSGVFLLPASLAPFGWSAVGGWLVTIAGTLVLAKVFASLTLHRVGSGNATGFVRAAFGPVPEFLVAWVYLVSVWTGIATIAVAAVSYMSSLVPVVSGTQFTTILSVLAVVWAVALVNLRSVRAAGGLQVVTLAIKLVPLLVVIVLTAGLVAGGEARPPALDTATLGVSSVNAAATLTMWALLGFESASVAAKQVEDPERNVPRATLWGTALTGLLYLIACSAVALLLPAGVIANSPAPFATFVERFWSAGPATFVALFAVVSCIGAVNGNVLLGGELPRAMARDGLLPGWLGVTDAAGTPRRALLCSGLIVSVFVVMNATGGLQAIFEFLLLLATSASLWFYLACALAALRLGVSRVLAAAGAIFALWTLWGAGLGASGLSLALVAVGLPLYWWARRERAVNGAEERYSAS